MQVCKGDVGIVDDGGRDTRNNRALYGTHSVMFITDQELTGKTEVAHLNPGGLYKWEVGWLDRFKYVCRCPDSSLSARAAGVALSWIKALPSMDDKKRGRNTYHTGRAKGVMHDLSNHENLTFGFDALRRAVKWSRRLDAPFSTNKGLSCAAWLVACYHAAGMTDPTIENTKREDAWKLIEGLRNPKTKYADRVAALMQDPNIDRAKAEGTAYYREHVNVGAKAADGLAQVLALLKRDKSVADQTFLRELLTPPMVVDGKFLHTDGLYQRIATPDSGWKVYERAELTKDKWDFNLK